MFATPPNVSPSSGWPCASSSTSVATSEPCCATRRMRRPARWRCWARAHAFSQPRSRTCCSWSPHCSPLDFDLDRRRSTANPARRYRRFGSPRRRSRSRWGSCAATPLSRLPLELAFTVRVSLDAVAQSAAQRIRQRMAGAGMELRLQLDSHANVWGDATLLEAALDEMLHNVFKHARSATVVQLRLRQATPDRCQLIVKDDGPGMSADRLAELFSPLTEEQPARGEGLGLYLLRRVAEAHGGRAWANSLEGKGTTFYLELPAASPDGDTVRASATGQQSA
ncbi:MAG: HAMP domain-containing histidine kinase [Chloroflexi bacterium]|nr:MAG: HAMP domain-containing histidine kinase [Chloroflexota bacterium]